MFIDERQTHVHICMEYNQKNLNAPLPEGRSCVLIKQSALGHLVFSVELSVADLILFLKCEMQRSHFHFSLFSSLTILWTGHLFFCFCIICVLETTEEVLFMGTWNLVAECENTRVGLSTCQLSEKDADVHAALWFGLVLLYLMRSAMRFSFWVAASLLCILSCAVCASFPLTVIGTRISNEIKMCDFFFSLIWALKLCWVKLVINKKGCVSVNSLSGSRKCKNWWSLFWSFTSLYKAAVVVSKMCPT